MWQELSDGIKAVILNSNLVEADYVFDDPASNISGYPAITISAADGDGEFADTARNRRTYIFNVKCYQERIEQGSAGAESIMRALVDDLIELFDANTYLDNDRLQGRGWVRPIPSQWAFIQGEQVDTRVANILIACVVIQ